MNKKPTNLDLSKKVYSHLLGENHTPTHRKIAGVIIMFVGIGFIKTIYIVPFEMVHIVGDVIGAFIHGVGTLPFIENITNHKNTSI